MSRAISRPLNKLSLNPPTTVRSPSQANCGSIHTPSHRPFPKYIIDVNCVTTHLHTCTVESQLCQRPMTPHPFPKCELNCGVTPHAPMPFHSSKMYIINRQIFESDLERDLIKPLLCGVRCHNRRCNKTIFQRHHHQHWKEDPP